METKSKAQKNKEEEMALQPVVVDCSFVDTGYDLDRRKIMIDCDLTRSSVSHIMRILSVMRDVSEEPITIYIASPGGSVSDGFALYDFMKLLGCPIVMIGYGIVASMGLIIYLAGDVRLSLKSTSFMQHSIMSKNDEFSKIAEIQSSVEELNRLYDSFLQLMADNTKKPKKWWKEQLKYEDRFFNAKEAKKLGIVNKILTREDL